MTIAVKLGVALIFSFSLSVILGKKDFVITPFVVLSHSVCHAGSIMKNSKVYCLISVFSCFVIFF